MSNKESLRTIFCKIRENTPLNERNAVDKVITEKLKIFLNDEKFKNIGFYWSNSFEVDTKNIILWAFKKNKNIFLPIQHKNGMNFCQINNIDEDLIWNPNWNTFVPKSNLFVIDNEELDLILIPLVSYDLHCNRLGMGKGCYDRWIKMVNKKPLLVGLARSNQQSENLIEVNDNDCALDLIITNTKMIRI